jgi:chondroitin 4-sulfotransferase 11
MKEKIRDEILNHKRIARIIFPIYVFLSYPIKLFIYGAGDPPAYFIFKKSKLIYLVNSKVAQTAITNTCGNKNKTEYSGIEEKNLGENKDKLSKNEEDYYSFTFVRNPFERLYSCYKSKYIADKERYKKPFLDFDFYLLGYLKKDTGFENFVKRAMRVPHFLADRHFKSQYTLIKEESRLKIDYIGRYESISDDFKKIQDRFNLETLPLLNKSGSNTWRDFYTKDLVSIVSEFYKEDLKEWYPSAESELLEYISKKET